MNKQKNSPLKWSKNILKTALAIYLIMLVAPVATGLCAPKPSLVAPVGIWQLDIELHGDPKLIQLTLPGSTEAKNYWYLLYTVTNNTGQDVDFFPQIELFSDTFKLYRSGSQVRNLVFEAIRDRYRKTIPLLESQDMVSEKLLQGRDNSRDSVAIFTDFDPNAAKVKLFISGASNETVIVKQPVQVGAKTQKPKETLLRKTLMLEYRVSGDRYRPEQRLMLYQDRNWIMR